MDKDLSLAAARGTVAIDDQGRDESFPSVPDTAAPRDDRLSRPSRTVEDAIMDRRSVRAFAPRPVPSTVVNRILDLAARSPSNSNTQPWFVHVVTGSAKQRLADALVQQLETEGRVDVREFEFQPRQDSWVEPFKSRRQAFGEGMYRDTLGLDPSDDVGRHAHHRRNYEFFGAPVGLVLTVSRHPLDGALIDAGIFLQTVALAARGFGLDTCPQASFIDFYPILREHLDIPGDHIVVCGIALGYADTEHPLNLKQTPRLGLDHWVRFHDE